jgi:hypothetical protein
MVVVGWGESGGVATFGRTAVTPVVTRAAAHRSRPRNIATSILSDVCSRGGLAFARRPRRGSGGASGVQAGERAVAVLRGAIRFDPVAHRLRQRNEQVVVLRAPRQIEEPARPQEAPGAARDVPSRRSRR